MGSVIKLSDYKNTIEKCSNGFFSQVVTYEEKLLNRGYLLYALADEIAKAIRFASMNPNSFVLNAESAKQYMMCSMHYIVDEEIVSPYFDMIDEEKIVRAIAYAMLHSENNIEIWVELYKLESYASGNREWEAFDFESETWCAGPGEGFFDEKDILK